jgi:hypothetical protein
MTMPFPTWIKKTPTWECCSLTTAQRSTQWGPQSSSLSYATTHPPRWSSTRGSLKGECLVLDFLHLLCLAGQENGSIHTLIKEQSCKKTIILCHLACLINIRNLK